MPRVATCKDCSARFKVPDNTTATRAKCKKCGGVLEIPPAAEATQAPPTAAPTKKSAPVKKAPVASKAPAKKATSSRTASAKRSSGARKTGERKSSRKTSKRAPRESDSKTGLIVGIAIVVIAVAGGGWWAFSGDDSQPPAKELAETASVVEETQTPSAAAEKAPSPESNNNETADASPSTADSSSEEPLKAKAPAKASAPAKAKAPAAVAAAPPTDPNAPLEPLPTLIEFEDLPPTLGSTDEDLVEWTALIKELYVDNFGGATGRRRKALLGKVRELDPVLSVPAYINAINGVDINDEVFVIAMYNLVSDWQQSVGYIPTFSYPADTTRMDTKVQNLRVAVLNSWRGWWVDQRMAGQDQAKLDDYRILIEKAVRPKEG